MEKTLSNLRKECKAAGIKVTKKTYSHGPHLSFEVDGISTLSVMTRGEYNARADRLRIVQELKDKYYGMEIDGQRVYGLSNTRA